MRVNLTVLLSKYFKIVSAVCFLLANYNVAGQTYTNEQIQSYQIDDNTFIFDGELDISAKSFIDTYRHLLPISGQDELVYDGYKTATYDTATQYLLRIKFDQYHEGIRVDKVSSFFVEDENRITTIVGNLVSGIEASSSPNYSAEQALDIAISALEDLIDGGMTFMWEDEAEENLLKELKADPEATWAPQAELVYTWQDDQLDGADYVLAWRSEIYALSPNKGFEVFVNATTGDFIKSYPLSMECGQIATATTMYNGSRSVSTHYRGAFNWNHILKDCAGGVEEIHTIWDSKQGGTHEITNGSTSWGTDDQAGTTAHFAAATSRDYFFNTFNREGIRDDPGHGILVRVNATRTMFQSDAIYVSSNGNNNYEGTLDIVGHEYSHGITRHSSNLIYAKESGALNESFSDIFGTLIEGDVQGSTDWVMGDDYGADRSLSNPNAHNQPSDYGGTHWFNVVGCDPVPSGLPGSNDNCGVHTNSGVQNHWFYNLANTIGQDKAKKIAYLNMTFYLPPTADYAQARLGSIQAARDLFGSCSEEVTRVREAWADRNVGSAGVDPYCLKITGSQTVCSSSVGIPVTYYYVANSSTPATAYFWSVNGNITYTTSGNVLKVTTFGNAAPKTISVSAVWGTTIWSFAYKQVNFRDCTGSMFPGRPQIDPDALLGKPNPTSDGVVNTSNHAPTVYPNPAYDNLTVVIPNGQTAEVVLLDLQGRQLRKASLNGTGNFNLGNIASGMYIVNITLPTGTTTKKIIINQ